MLCGDSQQPATPDPASKLLEWEDIVEYARAIFAVWVDQPELKWAEEAWSHLRSHDLTRYSTEIERHVVLCRLLVLGGVYLDFCDVASDESSYKDYETFAMGMKLDAFVLGRLYEQLAGHGKNDDVEMCDAMDEIVEAQRPAVVGAIWKGFGGEKWEVTGARPV